MTCSSTTHSGRGHILRQHIDAFTVVGISGRTSNLREAGPNGIIPRQWQAFFGEGIAARIPNKVSPEFYAVYTDYASDHDGDYTFIVGCRVKDGTAPPDGMVAKSIPAGDYAIVTSEKGPLPSVVPAAWRSVYDLENTGTLRRAYQSDFELYDQRAQDSQNAQVDLYLGLE